MRKKKSAREQVHEQNDSLPNQIEGTVSKNAASLRTLIGLSQDCDAVWLDRRAHVVTGRGAWQCFHQSWFLPIDGKRGHIALRRAPDCPRPWNAVEHQRLLQRLLQPRSRCRFAGLERR